VLPDLLLDLSLHADDLSSGRSEGWLLGLRDVILPPRLQRLDLHDVDAQPLSDLALPASLTVLALEGDCDQPLADWSPPAGLRELRLGGRCNHPVGRLHLPPQLEVLVFGRHFKQPLDDLSLPPSLTELHAGASHFVEFAEVVRNLRLPPSLRVLGLPQLAGASGNDDSARALLRPPAAGLPPSLRELHVSANAVRFDRLAAWSLPSTCVIHAIPA
jgi:hypothetical protein